MIVTVKRGATAGRGRDRLGRRRADRADRAAGAAARSGPHERGHDRADPPARRASPRPADRLDPQQARPPHRHRPAVQPAARQVRAPAARDPGGATTGPRQRPVHRQAGRRPSSVSTETTIYRWLARACCRASRPPPHAPWRIRLTDEIRARFVPDVPDGYLPLDQAAKRLGCARQTVLHKVQRGELHAVQVIKRTAKRPENSGRRQPALDCLTNDDGRGGQCERCSLGPQTTKHFGAVDPFERAERVLGWLRDRRGGRVPTRRTSCRRAARTRDGACGSWPGRGRRPPRRAARAGPRRVPTAGWWRSRSPPARRGGRRAAAAACSSRSSSSGNGGGGGVLTVTRQSPPSAGGALQRGLLARRGTGSVRHPCAADGRGRWRGHRQRTGPLVHMPKCPLDHVGPCSLTRSTASAILRRNRCVPAAAALTSHASAAGPTCRNARSSVLRARGVRSSAPGGRGG